MRNITKHIIHCSDSPDDRKVTVADIDSWHKQRGWKGIGYHYVIYRDGSIHNGRGELEIGAHCEGHNSESIGTCLIGQSVFTKEQFTALKQLHAVLKIKYPAIQSFGHRDFNPAKTCPNFDVKKVL